jgi:type I site-specific restriction endonuclease
MVGQLIGGAVGIASGMIGSGKRKREQRAAQTEFNQNKMDFQMLDTSNVYKNMENTMEDLTVNQEAAQFQAEQEQQGLSNLMGSMQGAAGGSGIASMVQAIGGQQSQNLRKASVDIGKQEQTNQAADRQQASNLQLYEKKGELISRDAEKDKTETLLGMSQQRLGAANQARKEATNSIVGGVGALAGAAAGAFGASGAGGGGTFGQELLSA